MLPVQKPHFEEVLTAGLDCGSILEKKNPGLSALISGGGRSEKPLVPGGDPRPGDVSKVKVGTRVWEPQSEEGAEVNPPASGAGATF